MRYTAKVMGLDEDIEEAVLLSIDGIVLNCFASVCPYQLQIGAEYHVQLHTTIFNGCDIAPVDDGESHAAVNYIDAFSYVFVGLLSKGRLIADRIILDDAVLLDFESFEGSTVRFKVDRLDVWFLED